MQVTAGSEPETQPPPYTHSGTVTEATGEDLQSKAGIYWPRVFTEGVTILLSILLAFAIDAWWNSRQAAENEQDYLDGLLTEFQTSRRMIEEQIIALEDATSATRELLSLNASAAMGMDPDSLALLFDRSIRVSYPQLPSGSLQALLASGQLNVIRDDELAARLATWPSLVAEAAANGVLLDNNRELALLPFLDQHMGQLRIAQHTGLLQDFPRTRFPVAARAMFATPVLEGHLTARAVRLAVTTNEYHGLASAADSTINSISKRREE